MSARVFIDGGAGTTGLEIAARLASRNDITLLTIDDAHRKDAAARRDAMAASDVTILCLPDDAAREAVTLADGLDTRIIDASSAHRTLPDWTYGFAEWRAEQRDAIARASRLSNPGCYATGFIALVSPLVAAGLIPADLPLYCHAVSGYSGGGKALISRMEQDEPDIAWRGYALGLAHKHLAEMQAHSAIRHAPHFSPQVVPAFRGMAVHVPLHRAADPRIADGGAMLAALSAHYAGSPIVRVAEHLLEELLLRRAAQPNDAMTLYVAHSTDGQLVQLVAMLDNLGKGAGGACVQNLNIMCGLPETAGLML